MDKFHYIVNNDEDMEEELFTIFSYDARKKEEDLKPEDYLPIIMKIERCSSYGNHKEIKRNILSLVAIDEGENQDVTENFRKCYTDILCGKNDEWILVEVRKDRINIELTFYSRKFHKRQMLMLDVRSSEVERLDLEFEVPHKNGRPSTLYKWQISRFGLDPGCTTIQKITPDSEKVICYTEGDDDISITEYTDLP